LDILFATFDIGCRGESGGKEVDHIGEILKLLHLKSVRILGGERAHREEYDII